MNHRNGEILLSIIVPAYNASSCICRCLDSLLDQNFHHKIEIIVVNDGSTDDTLVILDDYKKRYPDFFIIISKENAGVVSARNAGLDIAKGTWIYFCDADDYIVKDGLSYTMDRFIDDQIDICTFWSVTLDQKALKSFEESEVVKGNVYFEGSTLEKYALDFPRFVWNHIYRRNSIGETRFRNATMCEDIVFNLDMYMKSLHIRCTNTNIYRYTVSSSQLTRKRDSKSMRSTVESYVFLFMLAKQYSKEHCDNLLDCGINKMVANQFTPFMSRLLCSDLSRREFSDVFAQLSSKGVFPVSEQGKLQKLYNFMGRFSCLFPLERLLYMKVFIPFIFLKPSITYSFM